MSKLKELAQELGAKIVYFSTNETELKGIYIPDVNLIYVREDVESVEQENVILHEIGHCNYNHIHYDCHANMYSNKQESEANYYMISYRFNEWLSLWDFSPEPNEISIEQFMKAYHFENKMRWICEKVIEEYASSFFKAI